MEKEQTTVNRQRFQEIYQRSVDDVLRFWTPEMQAEIARHNVGWRKEHTNFAGYLKNSELRCWIAFDMVRRNGPINTWCDLGGFFGVHSLTLRRLGITVAMTEALRYYSDSFSPLFAFLQREGIEIIDHDPFEQDPLQNRCFDVVSAMAVLEHYPHSPKRFLESMCSIVAPTGCLYIEVPNIAFWPRRWVLLKGRSPLPPIENIFRSEIPFTGHHHEYTMQELHQLAVFSRLQVVEQKFFNYSFVRLWFKRFVSDPLLTLMSFCPSMRECLAVVMCHHRVGAMERDEERA